MDMLVGNILRQADKVGLRRIAIVEHTPQIDTRIQQAVCGGTFRRDRCIRAHLESIMEERALWCKRSPIEILAGAEIDADPLPLDGSLLLDDLTGLDLVLASTHFLPRGRGMWYDRTPWPQEIQEEMYQEWFSWAMHIAANPEVHILAHPGATLAAIGAIHAFEGHVLNDMEKLLRVCHRFNTAFELNEAMHKKLTPEQARSYESVFALARDLGVPIAVSSDAHHLAEVGRFDWVAGIVSRLGLTEDHLYHHRPPRTVSCE
jgi:histidinol phosphatase-like PHP family hydrolase